MIIATNIFEKLISSDKLNLSKYSKSLGDVKIQGYFEKSAEVESVTKYIIDDIDLKSIVQNPEKWDSFHKFILTLVDISTLRNDKFVDIRFWIKDLSQTFSLNIGFALNLQVDSSQLLNSLRQKLESEFAMSQERKNILIWLSYDEIEKKWIVKNI